MKDIESGQIDRLEDMLAKAGNIVVITHMKPDGDALGSSTAMYHYLKSIGKECRIVIPDPNPSNLDFLLDQDTRKDLRIYEAYPISTAAAIKESDLIICMDFNAFHRTDTLEPLLLESAQPKILIDHHLSPDSKQFSLVFSETEVSSASELLFHILMHTSQISHKASRIPAAAAVALMTGMTTDTNNFANSVYPSTLRMASALLEAGIDRDMILQQLYNRFSESRLRLMGHMMKDLLKITDDGVAYIVLDKETQRNYHVKEGDTEGFVNMPLSIDKVVMSILLKEDNDRIRVSIRSKRGYSANACAKEHFNGGVHENASGGRLLIGKDVAKIDDAYEYIERHTHTFMKRYNG